tara:strand:+ start:82 stop:450 length:369 start_codon:yes stop_codon:yes gene_type:complete
MGSMIQSQCKCGYESDELYVGGGMMDMGDKCELPFYCDDCEIVISRNILNEKGIKKSNRCPKCRKTIKYYGQIVSEETEYQENFTFDWGIGLEKRYYLKEELHHCPKCKKDKLMFYSSGCWD